MRIRRYALLAVIVLLALAAAVLPQTPQGRGWLVHRAQAILAANGIELRAARTAGNPWRGLRFEGLEVQAAGIDVEARTLDLRYFLPSLITGDLPLSIAADGVRGRVDVDALDLAAGGTAPPVRVRLDTLALADARIDVGDVPYAIPDLAFDEIRLAGGGDALDVEALLTTPDGSARLAGSVRLDPPRADLEVLRADLLLARPWWAGVTGGVASGRLRLGDGGIEADLDVRAGSLRELGLEATDIEGTVRYAHPRVDGTFSGALLGGRADVEGEIDLAAQRWRASASGSAALADTARWLARNLDADPGAWLEGQSEVTLTASGWRSFELEGRAVADAGRLFGRPLEGLDASFAIGPGGLTADGVARWSQGAVDVGLAPLDARTSQLTVALDDALLSGDLRGGADATFAIGPRGLEGRVDAALGGRLADRIVALEADAVATPDAPWELFVSGRDDVGGTISGAFVVDGGSIDGGVSARSLRLPGIDGRPTVALRASGPIADLPLRLEVSGDAPIAVRLDGAGRLATDLRGAATARLRDGHVRDVDGRFGDLAVTGSVAPGAAWQLDGVLGTTRVEPVWTGVEAVEVSVPRLVVASDPSPTGVDAPDDSSSTSAQPSAPGRPALRVTADVDVGTAVLGPASIDLPDLRLSWPATAVADDPNRSTRRTAGETAAPPPPVLSIASRDDAAAEVRATVAPSGTSLQVAGLPVTYGAGAELRRLVLAGTVRAGGDRAGAAIDARATGDGIDVTLAGTTDTTLTATARATAGLALGPLVTRAPLSLEASLAADRSVALAGALGALRVDAAGGLDRSGTATLRSDGATLELRSDGTALAAQGELDLGALAAALATRGATVPEVEGRLTTDLTAAWADLVGSAAGTAELRLAAPTVATAGFAFESGRVRVDLASEPVALRARGTLWPDVALEAELGPLTGLELRDGILGGAGALPSVEVGRAKLPELPWALEGTVGEAPRDGAADPPDAGTRDVAQDRLAPAPTDGSTALEAAAPTGSNGAIGANEPSATLADLTSGRARLRIGTSSVEVAWGPGWSLDASIDQVVALGAVAARVSGSIRAADSDPDGRLDVAVAADETTDPGASDPWLRAAGTLADLAVRADLPATVAAAFGPALPGGIAPRGRLVLDGSLEPTTAAYDLAGAWDGAPLRIRGRGAAFEVALDVPASAPDASGATAAGEPAPAASSSDDEGAAATTARAGLDGEAGPMAIRATRRAGRTDVAIDAQQTPLAALASRFDGLPEDLRSGATASALGFDGGLALVLDGATPEWSGDLRIAVRPGVDVGRLSVDVTGAAALRGDGTELRVAADLRITPAAAVDGRAVRFGADGRLTPRPDVRVDLAYAGAEAVGDLRWPAEAPLPTIEGRIRVPGIEGPVALDPFTVTVRGDASELRLASEAPDRGAATPGVRVDLRVAEGLAGTARIPVRILDRTVVADLQLGGTLGDPSADLRLDGALRGTLRYADDRLAGDVRLDPAVLPGPALLDAPPLLRLEATRDGRWRAQLSAAARWAQVPATLDLAVDGIGVSYTGRGALAIDGATLAGLALEGQAGDARLAVDLAALEPAAVAALSRDVADLAGSGGATVRTAPFTVEIDAALAGTVAGLDSRIEARGTHAGVDVDATVADVRATLRPRPSGGIALTARAEGTDVAGFVTLAPTPVAQLRGRVAGRTLRVDLAAVDDGTGAPDADGSTAAPLRLDASLADVRAELGWTPAAGASAGRATLALEAGTDLLPVAVEMGAALDLVAGDAPQLALNAQLGGAAAPARTDVALQGAVGASLDLTGSVRSAGLDAPVRVDVAGAPGAARVVLTVREPRDAIARTAPRDGLRAEVRLAGATVAAVEVGGTGRVAGAVVDAREGLAWRSGRGPGAPSAAGFQGRLEAELAVGDRGALHLTGRGEPQRGGLDVTARFDRGASTLATLEVRLPADPLAVDAPLDGALGVDAGTEQRLLVQADVAGTVRAPTLGGAVRLRGVVAADGSVTYAERRGAVALSGAGLDVSAELDGTAASIRARLDELPARALLELLPSAGAVPGLADATITLDAELSGRLDDGLAGVRGRIDPLRIATPASRLEGRASIADSLLATLRADLDLAELSTSLRGRLAGPVVLQGDPTAPGDARIDASLAAEGVEAAALAERFEAALLVRGPLRGPEIVVTVDATRASVDAGSLRLEVDPVEATGRLRSDLRVGPVATDLRGTWRGESLEATGHIVVGGDDADAGRGVTIEPGDDANLLVRGFGGLDGWSGTIEPRIGAASFRGPLHELAGTLGGTAVVDLGPLRGVDARRFGLATLDPGTQGPAAPEATPADDGATPGSDTTDRTLAWLRADVFEASVAGIEVGDAVLRATADAPASLVGDRVAARIGLVAPFAWTARLDAVGLPGGLAADADLRGAAAPVRVAGTLDLRGTVPQAPVDVDLAAEVDLSPTAGTVRLAGTVGGGRTRADLQLRDPGWSGTLSVDGARVGGSVVDVAGELSGPSTRPRVTASTTVDGPVRADGSVRLGRDGIGTEQRIELPGADTPLAAEGTLWPAPRLDLTAGGSTLRLAARGPSDPLAASGSLVLTGPWGSLSATGADDGGVDVDLRNPASGAGLAARVPPTALTGFGALAREPLDLRGTGSLDADLSVDLLPTPMLRAQRLRYELPNARGRIDLAGVLPLGARPDAPGTGLEGVAIVLPNATSELLAGGLTLAARVERNAAGAWIATLDEGANRAALRLDAGPTLAFEAALDRAGARLSADLVARPSTGVEGRIAIDDLALRVAGIDAALQAEASFEGDRLEAEGSATLRAREAAGAAGTGRGDIGTVDVDGFVAIGRWLPAPFRPVDAAPAGPGSRAFGGLLRLRTVDLAALGAVRRRAPNARLPVSGTLEIRDGVALGTFVAPEATLGSVSVPINATLTGRAATDAVRASIQGRLGASTFTVEADGRRAGGTLRLERFPVHALAESVVGTLDAEARATGVLRWSLPYDAPLDGELRLATERVELAGARGTARGTVTLDYLDRQLELRDVGFRETNGGAGTWRASGRIGADALDVELVADGADFSSLLDLVPALAPFGATAAGSFALRAEGRPTEPTASFTAERVTIGFAGGSYALEQADVRVEAGRLVGSGRATATRPIDGELGLEAEAQLSVVPFALRDAELRFDGELALPGVGTVDAVRGQLVSDGGRPRLEARGRLGAPVDLRGTLAPLALRLTGTDVQLEAPQWFLERGQADLDLRLDGEPGGVVLGGAVDLDAAAFALGLRQASGAPEDSGPSAGAGERGGRAARERVRFDALRVRAPRSLTLDENFGSLEARADLTLRGTAAEPTLEGTAEAIRGNVRFSGRDFALRTARAVFERSRGVFPRLELLAATSFETSAVTASGGTLRFVEPRDGPRFDVTLSIDGEVQATPGQARPFAVEVDPELASTARVEVEGGPAATSPRALANDELLQLVTLGRVDLGAAAAFEGDLATTVAQSAFDTAVDLLFLTELQQALGDALGVDVLELRTSRISSLLSGTLEDPFSVSLRVGQYLTEGVFASLRIGNIDAAGEIQALSNEVSLRYEFGPVALDLAGRVDFPTALSDAPVPSLNATVGFAVTPFASFETGLEVSSARQVIGFGVSLRW